MRDRSLNLVNPSACTKDELNEENFLIKAFSECIWKTVNFYAELLTITHVSSTMKNIIGENRYHTRF